MARSLPSCVPVLNTVMALCVAGSAAGASSMALSGMASPRRAAQTAAAACPPFPGADAFVDRIDNRFLPLIPGTTYIYETQDGDEKTVVKVTDDTKTILGVETVVVRDTVRDHRGELIEDTFDWFAQDVNGNVWYLGEDSKEYENGQVVSTEGSWEAGVDGAQPGIIMKAKPRVGDAYAQECAPGVAEDAARVLDLKTKVKIPLGTFGHVLRIRETNPLEPRVAEDKFYAPCVGMIRAVAVRGGKGVETLVEVKNGPSRTELGCKSQRDHKKDKGKDKRKHDDDDKRRR